MSKNKTKFQITSQHLDQTALTHMYFKLHEMQDYQEFEVMDQVRIHNIVQAGLIFYIEKALQQSLENMLDGSLH